MAFDNDIGNKNHEIVFIKHPQFVKLQNGHHITLIWQIVFKKGSIDHDVRCDLLYDDDDGHKDSYHDNPTNYGDNDN